MIYLEFLHQMSYEEIVQVMDMSEQAARNLTYRAMEKMRKEKPDLMIWVIFLLLISK
ncbi:sigma factor-like helix-turn-helix DNA-binding protein [Bacteroides sp. 51]|uniref:sigma factor-like helix-turn-helix DNA-binding protein n=1 Tax=Bacteroides sp. 51 TaxID=2302938 RepID=UPI00351B5CC1